MTRLNPDVVLGTELECLTATPAAPDCADSAAMALLESVTKVCPTLPGASGPFTPYGRVYIDSGGHIELAVAEADSPAALALMVERLQWIVARARERLVASGTDLLLVANNYSGLLSSSSPVWGSHENYLVERHPSEFTQLILPFLVSRIYGGAGGIEFPTGSFLAGVRPLFMETVFGGNTTGNRAIHSTCREEHHMGRASDRFRYHGILGDAHRSQFNVALQFGATALALKAVIFVPALRSKLAGVGALAGGKWLPILQRLNVLQNSGAQLHVDPLVIRVQRIYLDAAREYVDRLQAPPEWMAALLQDWEQTLNAFERLDRPWLSSRLDAFAKYELYSGFLADEGISWSDLQARPSLFHELTLLDHSYHNFCDPESVFTLLEREGLISHRVGPFIQPGEERDPYIPEVSTRAGARARFIREHSGESRYFIDWSRICDRENGRYATLDDPFAPAPSAWSAGESTEDEPRRRRSLRRLHELLTGHGDVPF